jgi:NADH-quinone oxidoreductase subunit G
VSATLPQTDNVTVRIDGIDVVVPKGTLLVEAAKQIDRDVPVYCYHPKLGPAGLCRICLVEIEGMPKLQIACNTPVADKMVVHTQSEKSNEGRRAVLELLLLNHPLDCPICDKGGECDLQDYSMAYGQGASRLADAKSSKPKAVDLGPTIVLDEERCILCLRCVRFDDIITGEQSLRTDDRGAHAMIATATGEPYQSDFSGNVTELCPVGALTSKTYRFKSRPWDNHRTTTTCMQCSVGCQMHVDARVATVQRTMSVPEDDAISDGWLCDRGRYNVGYVDDDRRLTQPLYRRDGEWIQIGWDDAIALWANALRDTIAKNGASSAGAIGGGRLLNEEAFLLQHVYRSLGVENLDWRSGRQHRAYPGDTGGTHVDLENAQCIITFGRSPSQLAPVLDLRVRKAVTHKGATLIAVGDHAPSPSVRSVRAATFADAVKAIPKDATRFAVVWDGSPSTEKEAVEAWAEALPTGTVVHTFIVGEQPNARGAEAIGMRPRADAADTQAMLEAARDGKLGVLALLGVNPVLHWPDRRLALEALEAAPFVVVSELFMTETAELATLVLPACSAFEKTGTTTNLAGDVLPVVAGVPAPGEAWADGDMLVALAEALGVTLPAPDEIEQRIRVLVSEVPPIPALPEPDAVPRAMVERDALRVIVESTIFTGGGTMAHDARLGELRTPARATIHPKTAGQMTIPLVRGDVIDIGGPGGVRLDGLTVVLDERVPAGAVVLVDGIPEAPLNALRGALSVTVTSKRSALEQLGVEV